MWRKRHKERNGGLIVKVTLGPAGPDADVSPGITLLEAWPGRAGLDPVCGGKGRCGGCRVRILGGDVSGADEDEVEAEKAEVRIARVNCQSVVLARIPVRSLRRVT